MTSIPEDYTDADLERVASDMLGLDEQEPDGTILDVPEDLPVDSPEPSDDGDDGDATPSSDGEEGDSEPSTDLPSSPSAPPALSPEQLLAYAQFDAVLNARPDLRQFVEQAIRGETPPIPTTPPPPAQPDIPTLPQLDPDDLVDPAVKALYDHASATQTLLQQERERINAIQSLAVEQRAKEFNETAIRTKATFATRMSLTPEQVEAVANQADKLGVSRALLSQTTDPASAIDRALELAYWSMPEHRKDAIESAVKERTAKARKRQKLAGVGGGSGSTPRDTAKPMSDAEIRQAMIADVADQWFGQPQQA